MATPPRHLSSENRRISGVSLVETIVVIGIMGMLLLVMNQIFILNLDLVRKQMGRNDNEVGAINVVRSISDAARGASAVVASRTVDGTAYTSTTDQLILQMPTIDASGNLVAGVYDYLAIARDAVTPTKIFADVEAGAGSSRKTGKRLITGYNQNLIFRYDDPDVTKANRISIYIINQQTVRQVLIRTKAWTSLFLRNYAY